MRFIIVVSMKDGIEVVEKTKRKSPNHRYARIWILRCSKGHVFEVNSCDAHERLCPSCDPNAAPSH
jgi:hypothetical protein